jgi:phage terminase small subunit
MKDHKPKKLRPPRFLRGTAKAWWAEMVVAYDFADDPGGRTLLTAAATQLQRSEEARTQIAKDGLCLPDRFGIMREHPCAVSERAATNLFRLLTRELGLEPAANTESTHAPRIAGRYVS